MTCILSGTCKKHIILYNIYIILCNRYAIKHNSVLNLAIYRCNLWCRTTYIVRHAKRSYCMVYCMLFMVILDQSGKACYFLQHLFFLSCRKFFCWCCRSWGRSTPPYPPKSGGRVVIYERGPTCKSPLTFKCLRPITKSMVRCYKVYGLLVYKVK